MIVELRGVSVLRGGRALLDDVDWHVDDGERWAVLGPNGSGKTTLVSVASTYVAPSRGSVAVLGRRVGSVDVRELRRHVGIVSSAVAAKIPPQLSALDVVLAGATGAIAPWWDEHDGAARAKARYLLGEAGCAALTDRSFELLSSGERQRVQIARALMLDPALLLLDEPFAGLDLGARETLALLLERLNADRQLAAIVLVTHHVEEIPAGTTHALVLRSGRVVAGGPVGEIIEGRVLSAAFGLALSVDHSDGRFRARARRDGTARAPAPAAGSPTGTIRA